MGVSLGDLEESQGSSSLGRGRDVKSFVALGKCWGLTAEREQDKVSHEQPPTDGSQPVRAREAVNRIL